MAVVGVALEDDDPAAVGHQVLDDPDADRAQPDDDDVPAHRPTRRCPNDRSSRLLTSSWVSSANRIAASTTPQTIRAMA